MKEKDGQEVRPEVKILLIEDCDKDTHLFRLAAEEAEKRTGCRFRITAVTTLSQAAEVFRSDLNDAVFFDLTLPDSAPLETIATLAAIAANFGRLYVLTESFDPDHFVKAKETAVDVLLKRECLSGTYEEHSLTRALDACAEQKKLETRLENLSKDLTTSK